MSCPCPHRIALHRIAHRTANSITSHNITSHQLALENSVTSGKLRNLGNLGNRSCSHFASRLVYHLAKENAINERHQNGKSLRNERQPNKWLAEWQIALHIYMPNESGECELDADKFAI